MSDEDLPLVQLMTKLQKRATLLAYLCVLLAAFSFLNVVIIFWRLKH